MSDIGPSWSSCFIFSIRTLFLFDNDVTEIVPQIRHFFFFLFFFFFFDQGPVVQSIVSLTNLLVDKMLTVLASTISNSQLFFFFAEKNVSSFCKCTNIFSAKNISVYTIFNDQIFIHTLINDMVSFEQLDP